MNIQENRGALVSPPTVETENPHSGPKRMSAGAAAQVAALVSAVVASACCWLPLVLIAFGVSGGALSATFEAWRPVFLPLTFLLLALAFYLTYRTPGTRAAEVRSDAGETCSTENGQADACCPPEPESGFSIRKFNKVVLWIVTFLVLAFAFFPSYVGALIGGNADTLAARQDLDKFSVRIDGMTCDACAVTIAEALRKVPGVTEVEVSYEHGEALIGVPKGLAAPRSEILAALSDSGYSGRFADQIHWKLAIEGMTCAGCASLLEDSLLKVSGVQAVVVSYENGSAEITSNSTVKEEQLRRTVNEAGFSLKSVHRD